MESDVGPAMVARTDDAQKLLTRFPKYWGGNVLKVINQSRHEIGLRDGLAEKRFVRFGERIACNGTRAFNRHTPELEQWLGTRAYFRFWHARQTNGRLSLRGNDRGEVLALDG